MLPGLRTREFPALLRSLAMRALPARASCRRHSPYAGPGLQYRSQFPLEHQLASILRRNYPQLLVASGGCRRPKLHVSGRRDGRGHGVDPGLHPRALCAAGQFLGGRDARRPLRPVAALSARRADSLLARHSADAPFLQVPGATLEGGGQTNWRSDRSLRRSPSNCSVRMAEASSTPTRRIRSRTPRQWRTCWRCCWYSPYRRHSLTRSARR